MIRVLKRIESSAWLGVLLVAAFTRWFALDTLPPGIKYDTASSGVYALNIVYNGAHPFYINPSGAPEPLMVYLQALAIYFFGVNTFTLRFLSAMIGIVTVALLYALAKETTSNSRIALIAAFTLAVAIEPINVSRTGLRAMLTPLFVTAWLLWFWRGWRQGRTRDFVIAGLILGLGMYTYLATLALILVAAGLWAHQFLFAHSQWRNRLRQFVLMAAITVTLILPRLIFQFSFPTAALNRTGQVSILQNPAIQTIGLGGVVIRRLIDYARMFGIAWQGELYNALHQPLLDPFLFTCFLLGTIICLVRLRRIEWVWAWLTLVVMLLPDLAGANEPSPNELRSIGMITPAFFFVGVGAVSLIDFASRWKTSRAWITVFMFLALIASATIGLHAYLVDFAATARVGTDPDYNRIELAEAQWIAQQSQPVILPLNEYARSPVHYLTSAFAPYLQSALNANGSLDARTMPNQAWVLLPIDNARPRTEGRAYVNDPFSFALIDDNHVFFLPPVKNRIDSTLATDSVASEKIYDSLGNVVANVYLIDNAFRRFQFDLPDPPPSLAQFANGITLIGGTLDDAQIESEASIGVSLFWQIARPLSQDQVIFAHVLDPNQRLISGIDVIPALGAYPTYLWKPGEIVSTHHTLKIPAHTPAGKYTVEVGMYNVLNQMRLDVLNASNLPTDSRVIVGEFKVLPSDNALPNPSHDQTAEFNQAIALTGFDIPQVAAPGSDVTITLYWQALTFLDVDYTEFVHVLDADGKIVAQVDQQPQDGRYPTSIWDAGEQVRDAMTLHIPPDLANGSYRLEIGWYDLQTSQRLKLSDGTDHLFLDASLQVAR